MRIHNSLLLAILIIGGVSAVITENKVDKKPGYAYIQGESTKQGEVADKNVYESGSNLGVSKVHADDNVPSSEIGSHSVAGSSNGGGVEESGEFNTFLMSISMILVSEVGDKTFLIAALMSMKHSRVLVFTAAFSSLAIMTVLSAIVGHALPTLLSRRLTQYVASMLFVFFGYRLLKEGLAMPKDMGVESELAEVEEEISSADINQNLEMAEMGQSATTEKKEESFLTSLKDEVNNLASFLFTPVFIQVFIMTFLGEWGDRSQIATIAMAAGSDYWIVIIGAVLGHGICTAAACIGGKLIATRLSLRSVTLGGSALFFLFSILYFYGAYYDLE